MRSPIPTRKSKRQRLFDTVSDALDVPSGIRARLSSVGSDSIRKAGLFAGALTGLTAGSAGISVLRRRSEGARGDS